MRPAGVFCTDSEPTLYEFRRTTNRRVTGEDRRYLGRLDTHAANLNLIVHAAEDLGINEYAAADLTKPTGFGAKLMTRLMWPIMKIKYTGGRAKL